ncbi:MAG: proton-conducting membrane transporter [Oscillospiraceae bacterium]|nr:proton-conducting membrane transporter [Oscillospiraceae bacterium]
MSKLFLLAAIFLPILAGACQRFFPLRRERGYRAYLMAVTLAASAITWALILWCGEDRLALLSFTDDLVLVLRFDGLGRFFAGIISTLWPMTLLYAFEYMRDDGRKKLFFSFFTMAYGVTLGVAMAGNLFTMYCFYELLTLSTVPLVLHPNTREAVKAARTYFVYSLGGAAFAFAAMIFLISNGYGEDFTFGGLLNTYPYARPQFTLIFYTLGVFGFGVKAAMFPTCRWLPMASVAPTPVTALLHAVAVVKSGVFAIIRLTWYAYGVKLLAGTWAQAVVLCFAVFTIFYGASRAVKETHWKRRLAWSTVANLSYIIFGTTLMTPEGLSAALLHMAFHAEIKILAFFCCGAVLHQSGVEYVRDLNGLGRRMPVTFVCFTVSAVALVGIPPFSGFVSKWSLLTAAANAGTPLAYTGAGILLLAALLTAIYMFTTVTRAWFPVRGETVERPGVHEANWYMTVPMLILTLAEILYLEGSEI